MELQLDVRRKLRDEIEKIGGRHDEPEMYGGPAGDPGLAGGPSGISWEINGDLASVLGGGLAAVVMEVLHPSVMAGVFTQSSYETDPARRARETLGYVLRTTFGNTEAATALIARVRRIHSHINGTRPDGVPYRALDPELIAWVHTCIPWAIMESFARNRRPLTTGERDQYLREQAPIGRMGGADRVPESMAELEVYVERMRPLMSVNEQTRSFLSFLVGDQEVVPEGQPRATAAQKFQARRNLEASMCLMPTWARKLTGTYAAPAVQRLTLEPWAAMQTRLVRLAFPQAPCVPLALARATGTSVAA